MGAVGRVIVSVYAGAGGKVELLTVEDDVPYPT